MIRRELHKNLCLNLMSRQRAICCDSMEALKESQTLLSLDTNNSPLKNQPLYIYRGSEKEGAICYSFLPTKWRSSNYRMWVLSLFYKLLDILDLPFAHWCDNSGWVMASFMYKQVVFEMEKLILAVHYIIVIVDEVTMVDFCNCLSNQVYIV